MELIALSAPWILLLLVIVVVGLLAFRKWKVAVGLLLLVVVGNWCFEVMPVGLVSGGSKFQVSGDELKVMTFNCSLSPKHEGYADTRVGVCDLIKEQNPDVVFLAENNINTKDSLWLMLEDVYPYHSQWKRTMGNGLYSKCPILSDTIYSEKGKGYGIICCRIDYRGQLVNVCGVHLSSNNYNEHMEYMTPDSVMSSEQARSYLGQIMTASNQRQEEARKVLAAMKELRLVSGSSKIQDSEVCRDPAIVLGDFNDVLGSPTLNVLKRAGLEDAWWEGGTGYGATINHPLTYRIDHILCNDRLMLKCVKMIDTNQLSDHNALVAELYLATY